MSAKAMVWPFENEPTTWPWVSTESDCISPAVKPFCVRPLTCTLPVEDANCDRPLLPKFNETLPRMSPFTVRFGTFKGDDVGEVICPLELNVNDVPVFCHATRVPVAAELV